MHADMVWFPCYRLVITRLVRVIHFRASEKGNWVARMKRAMTKRGKMRRALRAPPLQMQFGRWRQYAKPASRSQAQSVNKYCEFKPHFAGLLAVGGRQRAGLGLW
jgi:hypothetical protein